ncbi:HNH endonuclease signature motif containing protein [Agromyces sp. SYSU T00194]|uniref:HNH endonuclease signature motif containing protein n=1 Tax=Agromyces chitinivorans TaxID=3158560 RepID=UPI00339254A7
MRDGTCRFPGCDRRADASEIDHTVDWAAGGETGHDNLAHLCARHHHLKHEAGWRVVQRGGGVLEWRSPLGREYTTDPAEPMSVTRESERMPEREPHPPF